MALFGTSKCLRKQLMYLRKVIDLSGVLAITLPKDITNAVAISKGDYIEVHYRDRNTLIIKRHKELPKKITVDDK